MGDGTLTVSIRAARDLVSKDTFSASDPYCVLTVGAQHHTSTTKHDDNNPVWNESFTFNVTNPATPATRHLLCQIFDDDGLGSTPNTLGECKVDIGEVIAQGRIEKPYGLGKKTGTVFLVCEYSAGGVGAATVEEEEEEVSDWVGYDQCMAAVGVDEMGVEYELGFLESSNEPEYTKPTPDEEAWGNAMEMAMTIEHCQAFAINPDWGVQWYSYECFGDDGKLRSGEPGWVTWCDPAIIPAASRSRQTSKAGGRLPDQAQLAMPVDDSDLEVLLRAPMEKMGSNLMGLTWYERWVVLDTKQVSFFDGQDSKGKPKNQVPLTQILEVKSSDRRPNAFKIRTWNKANKEEVIICLDAKDDKTRKQWIRTMGDLLVRTPSGSAY